MDKEKNLYVKKPIPIEAIQWFKDGDHPEVKPVPEKYKGFNPVLDGATGYIDTLEGDIHFVTAGDWIIRGVRGEYYSCKPDIFAETYALLPQGKDRLLTDEGMRTAIWNMGTELEAIGMVEDLDGITQKDRFTAIAKAQKLLDDINKEKEKAEIFEKIKDVATLIEPTVEDMGEVVTQFSPFYQIDAEKLNELEKQGLSEPKRT